MEVSHLNTLELDKPPGNRPEQTCRQLSLLNYFFFNFSSCVWVLLGPLKIYISWSCHSVFEELGGDTCFLGFFSVTEYFSCSVWMYFSLWVCVYSANAKHERKNLLVRLDGADPRSECFPHQVTQHATIFRCLFLFSRLSTQSNGDEFLFPFLFTWGSWAPCWLVAPQRALC